MQNRQVARERRHRRVRKKVRGTAARPRLAVFRSNKHIYAQVIDDVQGVTARVGVDRREGRSAARTGTVDAAKAVGKLVGERAKERRRRHRRASTAAASSYHGRVAGVADGAREAGLTF